MDLFKMGKSLFSSGSDSHSSSSDGLNPFTAFKQLDRNGDGKITEEDFVLAVGQLGLGSVGEHGVRMAFKRVDKNKNGKLDLSEAMAAFEIVKDLLPKGQHE